MKGVRVLFEVQDRPGENLPARLIAQMIGVSVNTIHTTAKDHVNADGWASLKGYRFRRFEVHPQQCKPSTESARLRAALERGQKVTLDSDVRIALAWLGTRRRLQEELDAVLAGKAALTICDGRCCVLRNDRPAGTDARWAGVVL